MRKLITRLGISLILGALLLYFALGNSSFSQISARLQEVDWSVLMPFFLLMAIQHFFRSWRWGQLLAPIHPVPIRRLFPISSVGFLAILALPLRMGEFVRPVLITEPPHLRVSHGLGTIAVERVFDGLILSLIAFLEVARARASGRYVNPWVTGAGAAALSLFCVALVVLAMALWQRDRAVTLCHRLVGLVSKGLADRAASIAAGIVDGFRALPDWRRISTFTAATAAYWVFNIASIWYLAKGFDLNLPFLGAAGTMAMLGIGIMVPAAPGFVGSFEVFSKAGLSMYVSPAVLARSGDAYVLTMHAMNVVWYTLIGVISLFSPHVSFADVLNTSLGSQAEEGGDPPRGGE